MSGEHFLPFRRRDVVAMCAEELPEHERPSFVAFAGMLASLLHHQLQAEIEAIKDAYHPFQPDGDTRQVRTYDAAERDEARRRLEDALTRLALAANFQEMSLSEVKDALAGHSVVKLKLEIDERHVDKVLLFRRGESEETREEKRFFGRWGRRTVKFRKYSRVLVYTKFKDEITGLRPRQVEKLSHKPGSIIIKLFQNVPQQDLEMVFPSVQIRMRLVDKIFVGVPALVSGVVVIVTKLWLALSVAFAVLALWLGLNWKHQPVDETTLIGAGVGLFAFGAYAVRQVNNFKNRKIQFMKLLSESLYFRNLDNDAGVFHHLLDAAEEAESIEAVLAYHFLRQARRPLDQAELDARVETWFRTNRGIDFDYEVDDGVRKLTELGLVTTDEQGRLTPIPIDAALSQLDQLWDNAFTYAPPATPPLVSQRAADHLS